MEVAFNSEEAKTEIRESGQSKKYKGCRLDSDILKESLSQSDYRGDKKRNVEMKYLGNYKTVTYQDFIKLYKDFFGLTSPKKLKNIQKSECFLSNENDTIERSLRSLAKEKCLDLSDKNVSWGT